MNLLKLNIFKSGVFKNAKYMVSAPSQFENVVFQEETGVLTLDLLPLDLGVAISHKAKMGWHIIQKARVYLEGVGMVTVVTSRSRIPADPFNKITVGDKAALAPDNELHRISYNKAYTNLSNKEKQGPNERVVMTIIWIEAALIAVSIIGLLIRGW